MAKVPIFIDIDTKVEHAIIGGSDAEFILGRACKSSEVAGDISAMEEDDLARVVFADDDATLPKGIVVGMYGIEYDKDDNDHFIGVTGQDVYIVKDGQDVLVEIGETIVTKDEPFGLLVSPGADGVVAAVNTNGADHYSIARLKNHGTYAKGDLAWATVQIGIIPSAETPHTEPEGGGA